LTGNRFEPPVNGRKQKKIVITVNQFRFQSKYGQRLRFTSSVLTQNAIFVKVKSSRRNHMQTYSPEQALAEAKREFGEHGGVTPSIARSSTFTVMDPAIMPEIFGGIRGPENGGCFLYSRHFNPTVDILARYLAAIEGTEAAVCTASGMSAISCTLLQLCNSGDHIVASNTIYGARTHC